MLVLHEVLLLIFWTSIPSHTLAGQISDDYGIKKLQFVYYDEDRPNQLNKVDLSITNENILSWTCRGEPSCWLYFEPFN